MRLDDTTCGMLRSNTFKPRTNHELTLLAQLPEFYSDDPSHERLRALREEVEHASDVERGDIQRRVVSGLCPDSSHGTPIALALLILLVLIVCSA